MFLARSRTLALPLTGPLAILAALWACGRAPQAPVSTPENGAPARRIVPGNTAAAELLAALFGEAEAARIAALPEQVDAYSSLDFHTSAWSRIPRFSRYSPEPLIALHPDLVVTHEWQAAETTQVLRDQGMPVLVLRSARSYEDVRGTLELLGRALRLEARALELVGGLDRRVAKLRESSAAHGALRALEYSNNGTGGWTAGKETTADAWIRIAGMRNAAAEAGLKGHVVLDFERLLSINPDVIVVGAPARDEVGSPTKGVLESTAALAGLSAVKEHRIVVLPASLISSDSQCMVDTAERLAAEVDAMSARAAGVPARKP